MTDFDKRQRLWRNDEGAFFAQYPKLIKPRTVQSNKFCDEYRFWPNRTFWSSPVFQEPKRTFQGKSILPIIKNQKARVARQSILMSTYWEWLIQALARLFLLWRNGEITNTFSIMSLWDINRTLLILEMIPMRWNNLIRSPEHQKSQTNWEWFFTWLENYRWRQIPTQANQLSKRDHIYQRTYYSSDGKTSPLRHFWILETNKKFLPVDEGRGKFLKAYTRCELFLIEDGFPAENYPRCPLGWQNFSGCTGFCLRFENQTNSISRPRSKFFGTYWCEWKSCHTTLRLPQHSRITSWEILYRTKWGKGLKMKKKFFFLQGDLLPSTGEC